jgi:hypothetical protein
MCFPDHFKTYSWTFEKNARELFFVFRAKINISYVLTQKTHVLRTSSCELISECSRTHAARTERHILYVPCKCALFFRCSSFKHDTDVCRTNEYQTCSEMFSYDIEGKRANFWSQRPTGRVWGKRGRRGRRGALEEQQGVAQETWWTR